MVEQVSHRRSAGIVELFLSRSVRAVEQRSVFTTWTIAPEGHRSAKSGLRAAGLGLLMAGTVAACGGGTRPWLGHTSQAVLGGEASGADQDGVVLLTMEEGDTWSSCTATLVAPSLIVTAKHCVVAIQPGDFFCTGDGEPLDDGSGAGTFRQTSAPQTLRVYVGAQPARQQPVARGSAVFATESEHVCRDDVAVVTLDRPIDWVPVVSVGEAPLRSGQEVSVIGYGTKDPSEVPERRFRQGVRVLDIGALVPEDRTSKPTTPPRTFTVEGATVCFGDSGGPALNDAGELVGILSRLSGDCAAEETRNTYMTAKSFLDLVDRAVASTSGSDSAAKSEEGSASASGKEPSSTKDDSLSMAGAPPSSDTLEADEQLEPSSSSSALRCQISAALFSGRESRSRLWAVLTLLVLGTRRAFGGVAHRDARYG
jgi:hypothetical protein